MLTELLCFPEKGVVAGEFPAAQLKGRRITCRGRASRAGCGRRGSTDETPETTSLASLTAFVMGRSGVRCDVAPNGVKSRATSSCGSLVACLRLSGVSNTFGYSASNGVEQGSKFSGHPPSLQGASRIVLIRSLTSNVSGSLSKRLTRPASTLDFNRL